MKIRIKTEDDDQAKKQLISKINSLQAQVDKFEKMKFGFNRKDKELKECVKGLEERVECRTFAERIINKQLHG